MNVMKILLHLLLLLSLAFSAEASIFLANDTIILSQEINQNLYLAGKDLKAESVIKGDLFGAFQNVKISRTMFGDVALAAQDVLLDGPINGDVRIVARKVVLNSDINGEVLVFSDAVRVEKPIAKSLTVFSRDVIINGNVSKRVKINAETVVVNSTLESDAVIHSAKLVFAKNGIVKGNLNYSGKADNLAAVKGIVKKSERRYEQVFMDMIAGSVLSYLSFLILGILILLLAPRPVEKGTNLFQEKYFTAFIIGMLSLFVVPVILLLIFITVIGIPVALFGLALFILMIMVAKIFFILFLGEQFFARQSVYLKFALSLAIYVLLMLIPGIGLLITLFATATGLGVIFLMMFPEKRRRRR